MIPLHCGVELFNSRKLDVVIQIGDLVESTDPEAEVTMSFIHNQQTFVVKRAGDVSIEDCSQRTSETS